MTVPPCLVGYTVFRPSELDFDDRGDGSGRTLYALPDRLTNTRARFWRYPPRARGRPHAEAVLIVAAPPDWERGRAAQPP